MWGVGGWWRGVNGHVRTEASIKKRPSGYSLSRIMLPFCLVAGCRHPMSHVTRGHKCGTCGQYGHGQMECGVPARYPRGDTSTVPNVTQCAVRGCRHKALHTTGGHRCATCGQFGHECGEHRARLDGGAGSVPLAESAPCVVCRRVQPRASWVQTFVSSECPVCLEQQNILVSNVCWHGICGECLPKL